MMAMSRMAANLSLCLSMTLPVLAAGPQVAPSVVDERDRGAEYDAARQSFAGDLHTGTTNHDGPSGAPGGPLDAFYGVDVASDELLLLDKDTAAAAVIAPVATPTAAGLAFDAATGLLFATDTSTRNLVTIDPEDGTTTVIGDTGVNLLHGLAIDPGDGVLYASDAGLFVSSNLYRLDRATGAAELVGPTGFIDIGALDFDPVTGLLYGASSSPTSAMPGNIITIDTSTGEGAFVAETRRTNGIAFDRDGVLYGSDNGLFPNTPNALYVIDTLTGEWTLIGHVDPLEANVLGIDFAIGQRDADGDGVTDELDLCTDTAIPESVPTNHLDVNRWALTDDDDVFDTTAPPGGGGGPEFEFSVIDTAGCSCEQIIEAMALGWGHTKFGCSTGAMLQWIAQVGDVASTGPRAASHPGGIRRLMERGLNPVSSIHGAPSAERDQPRLLRPRIGREE